MTIYVKEFCAKNSPEAVDEILARRKRMEDCKRRVEEAIRGEK